MNDERPTGWDTVVSRTNRQDRSHQGDIPRDELFELLASARRREIVAFLARHSGDTVQFENLIAVVAEGEDPDSGPATHRGRVTTDVHHVHLPKLEHAEVLSYDPEAEIVEYHGSERLESLLAASEDAGGVDE
jgi:DNA-binding transcriptional ArsR family regulator